MGLKLQKHIFRFLRHRKYTLLLVTLFLHVLSLALPSNSIYEFISNLSLTLVLLGAVNASHGHREKATYIYGIVLIVTIRLSDLSIHLTTGHALLLVIFLIGVTLKFLGRLLSERKFDLDYLSGAVGGYILLGIIGGYIGMIIYTIAPDSFAFGSALAESHIFISKHAMFLYRSFSTLTTLGYGDVSPVFPVAISCSILIVLFGQIYLTVLLGIILSKFLAFKNQGKSN